MTSKVQIVAQYFPQLHAIPENDAWWGEGFTDWVNVKRAKPYFEGHDQPRLPLGGRYYDQSKLDTVRWQVELAKAHGVDVFCHYHYWFDGTHLLHAPTDLLLANKSLDIKFCLTWANETWSRRWDGQDHHILIAQTHPPTVESWGRHFDVLIKYWLDERALRIDGKPVFLIYRALKIPQLQWMFDYWQTRAKRDYGLPGLFFVNVVQFDYPPWELLRHFDATMLFQPFTATRSGQLQHKPAPHDRWVPLAAKAAQRVPVGSVRRNAARKLAVPNLFDYDAVWEEILRYDAGKHLPTWEGAFVDWDNTARYQNRATIYQGATPEKFGTYMKRLVDKVAKKPERERLVFINAWNEWAEAAYLEPDEQHGTAYLDALKAATR